MSTTHSKRIWPEGLESTVLLKLDLNNYDVFGILHWFFDGPTQTFLNNILAPGKRWILLHKNFTYDTLSNIGESALGLGLGGADPKDVLNTIFNDKKWPAKLPESFFVRILADAEFNSMWSWFENYWGFSTKENVHNYAWAHITKTGYTVSVEGYKAPKNYDTTLNAREVLNHIKGEQKWPDTLPESVCLTIDTCNPHFRDIRDWFKINSNGEIGLSSALKGFAYVTLRSDFTFYCHPYDTAEKVYITADVWQAIQGKKDLVNGPVYGPVLSCIKGLFLKAGLSDKDVDEVLGKYASAPKGKPGLPDFAIPVPPRIHVQNISLHPDFESKIKCVSEYPAVDRLVQVYIDKLERCYTTPKKLKDAVIEHRINYKVNRLLEKLDSYELKTLITEFANSEYQRGREAEVSKQTLDDISRIMYEKKYSYDTLREQITNRLHRRQYVPIHVQHDPESPYYNDDMD